MGQDRTGLDLSMPMGQDRPRLVNAPGGKIGLGLPMLMGKGRNGLVYAWVAIKGGIFATNISVLFLPISNSDVLLYS